MARKLAYGLGGALALLAGLACLGHGLAPLGGLGALFGGNPGNLPPTFMDDLIAAMKAGVPWDIAGAVLAITGLVFVKLALRKPKPPSMEEQVEAAVARRLAELGITANPRAPNATQQTPQLTHATAPAELRAPTVAPAPAAPHLVAAPPAGCPTCGQALVGGGRFCRACGRVA